MPGRRPHQATSQGHQLLAGPPCRELERLLDLRNAHPRLVRTLDREIAARFGTCVAVLVLDMAGFSVSVRRHGIIHHLALIRRMNCLAGEAVARYGGAVVKFEADNCYAVFPTVAAALRAARHMARAAARTRATAPRSGRIEVSIGIGYGDILLAADELFGDEVNIASKLGEDLAGPGEILLTAAARRALGRVRGLEPLTLDVSGMKLAAYRAPSGVRSGRR